MISPNHRCLKVVKNQLLSLAKTEQTSRDFWWLVD